MVALPYYIVNEPEFIRVQKLNADHDQVAGRGIGILPVSNGAIPPELLCDPDGNLIYVEVF